MSLVVIQNHNLVLKHLLHILFCVQVEPVFEAKTAEFVKHLLLLKEVDLLGLLRIALFVETHKL